jgi:LmbE family N-acetylglucosaminyl deacetylase
VASVSFLDYVDGDLDQADAGEAIERIVRSIRRVRPQVVLTFGHDGLYGHPDHIAICQLTTAAIVAAASSGFQDRWEQAPHAVSKLYYRAAQPEYMAAYESAFGELVMRIDGQERRSPGWQGWTITTRIDARDHWRTVWDAVRCHRSQLPGYERLLALSEDFHRELWGTQEFYRALSLGTAGRQIETDLFAGLRTREALTTPGGEGRWA